MTTRPKDPTERFFAKVDKRGPVPANRPELGRCWVWTGATGYGHGQVRIDKVLYPAHRVSYEMHVGPIPAGLDIDHLCRNRPCVNPTHLEPVTRRENLLRGETTTARNAAKTHCPQSHPYDAVNTYVDPDGQRRCRTCTRDKGRARNMRLRAAKAS